MIHPHVTVVSHHHPHLLNQVFMCTELGNFYTIVCPQKKKYLAVVSNVYKIFTESLSYNYRFGFFSPLYNRNV